MVRLSKIYTKTGDTGGTMLGDGSTVPKQDTRVAAYGTTDEANAAIGTVTATIAANGQATQDEHDIAALLQRCQNDLFDVGADLCVPVVHDEKPGDRLRITTQHVDQLEAAIDKYNELLEPLTSFILPGGTPAAAGLHLARTVTRRAEREVSLLIDTDASRTNKTALVYLNRLSDLLFVLARVLNVKGADAHGDVLWNPGGGMITKPEKPGKSENAE